MYCNIKISIKSKEKYVKAIIDTGNFLKEPISKTPVIVVEKEKLQEIVPSYILENLNKIINGDEIDLKEYIPILKIIPFTSLGKENGILVGLKADNVLIELEENVINIINVIIGIYDGELSKSNKYNALIGLELLETNEYQFQTL